MSSDEDAFHRAIVVAERCFFQEQFNVAQFTNAETSSQCMNRANLTYHARFCRATNFFSSSTSEFHLPSLVFVYLSFDPFPGIFCNFYQACSPRLDFDPMYFASDAFKQSGRVRLLRWSYFGRGRDVREYLRMN